MQIPTNRQPTNTTQPSANRQPTTQRPKNEKFASNTKSIETSKTMQKMIRPQSAKDTIIKISAGYRWSSTA
jgi:hypothetical protein